LRQTACLLSGRGDITVVEGQERKGWSFNSVTGVISMDSTRLRTESAEFNRGLLMHEGAHAAITRLRWLIQGDLYARPEVFAVINAVEDCRIESWLLDRFPGARPWIEEYNGKLIRTQFKEAAAKSGTTVPLVLVLPWLIVSSWWHGPDGIGLPPEWRALRDEVWPAVDAIRKLFPSAQIPVHEIRNRYTQMGLPARFLQEDGGQDPDVWEKEIRVCQAEMWQHFERGITPVLRRLVPELGKGRHRESYRRWLSLWLEDHWGPNRCPNRSSRVTATPGAVPGCPHRIGAGREPSRNWDPDLDLYETLRQRQSRAIEHLSEEILRRLQPEVHRRWTGPHTSGSRLCLRSVIRSEGDPRLGNRVWRRRSDVTRPDPLIVLVVDRSGSMEGERMQATTEATVLLSETCTRCGIGLSVFAFAGSCTQIVDWRQPVDEPVRARLGGLARAADGGTDLENALREVRAHVEESEFDERYVVVLSDGAVADTGEVSKEVGLLEREGVRVIGLGLGPDTDDLRNVIQRSFVGLKPPQLPVAFIRLLGRAVQLPSQV
jgi:uncharacterized protein YegL